ncbi:MAG TPA: 50S ribosomal protein L31 [Anaerolineae bacterium]|nr:50S ribosomal protein L31 [Anaerolineae bacterium]
MKKETHPEYYPDARVVCGCGNSFVTGATKQLIKTDICSACHPFFTGEQRIVDTAGQVERYMKRLERRGEMEKSIAATAEPAEDTEGEGSRRGKRGKRRTK